MKTHGTIRPGFIKLVIMNRVQEVLTFDNFLLFLDLRKLYTNRPTYLEYLSLWITKASTGPIHHK
jgi:hypothetical protein